MMLGVQGKTQKHISDVYEKYDAEDSFPKKRVIKKRFESVISAIDGKIGGEISTTAFRRPALFYSLFLAVYDHMYGLKSALDSRKSKLLPPSFAASLSAASKRIQSKTLPASVQDAMDKATADKARREVRHKYLLGALGLERA